MKIITKVTIPILLVLLIIMLTGCSNAEKEHENVIKKTITDVNILNEKSDFGECKLLARGTESDYIALSYTLGDEKSSYLFFPFSDGNYVTQIVLATPSYHVFGIRVGDEVLSVDEILKKEGYKKGEINKNAKWDRALISFSKKYISIAFYADSSNSAITKIVVNVSDPKYADIVY